MKKCTLCKEHKDLKDFPPDRRNKLGVSSCCRLCTSGIQKKYRVKSPNFKVMKKKSDAKHYANNKERLLNNMRERDLQVRYGISQADYEDMFEAQNGLCAICEKPWLPNLYVDHCHESGRVRGLLCPGCNFQLGVLDKRDWVAKALSYLQRTM